MNGCLILFARSPRLGTVKTRLQTNHTPEQVRRLYVAFLRDTLEMAGAVRGADRRVVAFTPRDGAPLLRRAVGTRAIGFEFVPQQGADLGERLRHSFLESFRRGAARTVIIGTDSPSLPAQRIEEAFAALVYNDMVLGPSTDGGFYLVGVRSQESGVRSRIVRSSERVEPGLQRAFAGVAWSTDRVLEQTIANARRARLKTHLLAPWYDVDDATSLRLLQTHLKLRGPEAMARNTRRALRKM